MAEDLDCGIVGLPNVGKSTFFNAVTSKLAEASNYPFCTIDPNVGEVDVPDTRLQVLSDLSGSAKIVPATLRFIDIAGLVEGASQGQGLGNKFLSNIRETDAIIHVVRCFEGDGVIHVNGKVDPINDISVIQTELILADYQMCENAIMRLEKQIKGKKELVEVLEVLQKVFKVLEETKPASSIGLTVEELDKISQYPLLTLKPVLYLANVSESDLPEMHNTYVEQVKKHAEREGNLVIPICAKVEEEIAQLDPEEREAFLQELGLMESGLDRLIKASFKMLGMITFLTTGHMETRAWTIKEGTCAWDAAGKIHTDIQKGFVRAEVVKYKDFIDCGGRKGAKDKGLVRAEGKEYIMQDGDVVLFLHT